MSHDSSSLSTVARITRNLVNTSPTARFNIIPSAARMEKHERGQKCAQLRRVGVSLTAVENMRAYTRVRNFCFFPDATFDTISSVAQLQR
jgi:hypothetical protein